MGELNPIPIIFDETFKIKIMKKGMTILGLMMVGIISFSSCKKCGHCEDSSGNQYDSYCSNGKILQNTTYNSYQSACETNGDNWVKD